jgi:hypothetical protein
MSSNSYWSEKPDLTLLQVKISEILQFFPNFYNFLPSIAIVDKIDLQIRNHANMWTQQTIFY